MDFGTLATLLIMAKDKTKSEIEQMVSEFMGMPIRPGIMIKAFGISLVDFLIWAVHGQLT